VEGGPVSSTTRAKSGQYLLSHFCRASGSLTPHRGVTPRHHHQPRKYAWKGFDELEEVEQRTGTTSDIANANWIRSLLEHRSVWLVTIAKADKTARICPSSEHLAQLAA
jgi:hypothetical protein